jgi:hypothetical protein
MTWRCRSLVCASAIVLALGCADTNPGIAIEGLKATNESCGYAVDQIFAVGALLDTSVRTPAQRPFGISYFAVFQVANRFLNLGNARYPLQADPNTFHGREMEVELRGLDGVPLVLGGLPNPYRVPAMGFVPSAGTDTAGLGLVASTVIPTVYGDALAGMVGTIVVVVNLIGTTTGGSTQITGEYQFPLELCNGCLFACVLDSAGMAIIEPSCRPGQDETSLTCP